MPDVAVGCPPGTRRQQGNRQQRSAAGETDQHSVFGSCAESAPEELRCSRHDNRRDYSGNPGGHRHCGDQRRPGEHSVSPRKRRTVAVDAATAAIAEAPLAEKVLGEPEMLGVQELSPDLLTLRMTLKTRPGAQWSVQRRLRREILRAYDENGIDLPYPHGRIHALVGGKTNGDAN